MCALSQSSWEPLNSSGESSAGVNAEECLAWKTAPCGDQHALTLTSVRTHPASEVYVTGTFDDWSKSEKLTKTGDVFAKEVTLSDASTADKIYYKVRERSCLGWDVIVVGKLSTRRCKRWYVHSLCAKRIWFMHGSIEQ